MAERRPELVADQLRLTSGRRRRGRRRVLLYRGLGLHDTDGRPTSSWELGCGTSLASPITAGVYALAGNASTVNWAAQIPYQHTAYLHDVTSGYNGSCGTIMCRAAAGYDGPTGVGTPRGLGGF